MPLPATPDAMDMPLVSNARRLALRNIGGAGAALLVSGCSSIHWNGATPSSTVRSQPPFYRLTLPGSHPGSAWLLSSIHAGSPELFPLPPEIVDRFRVADDLAVELNIPKREAQLKTAFTERAFLPSGQTLEDYLEPTTIRWLKRRFTIGENRWRALARLQPWALTRALHGSDHAQPTQAQVSLGLEARFLELAGAQTKPVRELESPDDQIRALAGGSIRWQAELLNQRVSEPQFWDNKLNQLIRAWRKGDQAALLKLKLAAFGTDSLRAPLRQRLFTDRDRQMASRLVALMREPRSVFAVVGAFHLVGQSSLRTQLIAMGVSIERIKYPEPHPAGSD